MGPGPVTPEKPPELASDPDLPAAQRAACPATCSFGDLFSHHQTEPSADRAIRGCPGSENGQVLWLQRGEPWGAWVAAVFPPVSSLCVLPSALVLALQTSSPMTRKLVQLSLTQEAREGPREDTDWPVWVTCPPLKSSLRPAPGRHLWLSPLIYGPPRSTTHVRLFSGPERSRYLSQVLFQLL